MTQNDLTEGSLPKLLLRFSIPYLISCFLQTFYGLADLFITGQFNGASTISAVSIGSQIMHMLTVLIVGLAMGTTVCISRGVGAKDEKAISRTIGNSVLIFSVFALVSAAVLLLCRNSIVSLLDTPPEAVAETISYVTICFIGVPFITAYNVISSIFRGLGNTRTPMYFVAIAGVINIILDYILIGPYDMGARGAALATVLAQSISVILALIALTRLKLGIKVSGQDFKPDHDRISLILRIGVPIAIQEGLIQISFLVITAIANDRGVDISAAVGIVEKVISFLFLVPSAMLSAVSVAAAQNRGAGKHRRACQAMRIGIWIVIGFGSVIFIMCQFISAPIVGLFAGNEENVIIYGEQYLKSYSVDCIFAGIHFCFSGFFSAYEKSIYSFIHNMISVVLVRVPGAYLASVLFPATLWPMGLAAPMGSLLSIVICIIMYRHFVKRTLQAS